MDKKKRLFEILREERILNKPKNINEMVAYADKYLVKDKVKHIANLHVAKVLGTYDNAEDIDYDNLPDKFVIKVNHWWNDTKIITDKSTINYEEIKRHFNPKLKDFFSKGNEAEHHYRLIKPKLFVEEYLGHNLNDYKFNCIHGKVVFVEVFTDRFTDKKRTLYTKDWMKLGVIKEGTPNGRDIEIPIDLPNMVKICENLSKAFNYVRVDLYQIDGKIYFGELTFTPMALPERSLMEPESFDYLLGEMLQTGKIDYEEINKFVSKEE